MQKTITLFEAIKEGYEYATIQGGDGSIIVLDEYFEFETERYWLCEKKGEPYSIEKDDIHDMIIDSFNNQDQVSNENSALDDAIADVDFLEITKTVNEHLAAIQFYKHSDIELIPF